MRSLLGRALGRRAAPSEVDVQDRLPVWPGWIGALVLVAVNLLQVGLNWWILRGAADEEAKPSSAGAGALRVAALVVAHGLQTGLTWWFYREAVAAARRRS